MNEINEFYSRYHKFPQHKFYENSFWELLRKHRISNTEPLTIPLETINFVFGVEEKCHHIRVNPNPTKTNDYLSNPRNFSQEKNTDARNVDSLSWVYTSKCLSSLLIQFSMQTHFFMLIFK